MKYWVTTDWHLNHENIKKYEYRKDGFEQLIIQRHNEVMSEDDVLINLGDVIFARNSELSTYLSQLKCHKKILVRGNHDRKTDTWYMGQGFDIVFDSIILKNCLLSHAPKELTDDLSFNIHGHFHTGEHRIDDMIWYPFYSERHILFGLENTNYYPVLLNEIMNGKYVKKGKVFR